MGHQTERRTGGSTPGERGPALAILATAPRPGLVLRGLCPPLTAAEAAALQTAWLKSIAQELPGIGVHLFGRPADALPMLRYFAGPGVDLREWRAAHGAAVDLGALAAAAVDLFAAGHAPVLARAADAPDVPTDDLLACAEVARRGGTVIARDQRGAPWLLALPDAEGLTAVLARPDAPEVRRGPWARTVATADDLDLLLRERRAGAGEHPFLPVRDLQAALRFHEVVTAAELVDRDRTTATIAIGGALLELVVRGAEFAPNGVQLRVDDVDALAVSLAAHHCAGATEQPVRRTDDVSEAIGADPDGNRLVFASVPAAR